MKHIPLSQLETDPSRTLLECCDTGEVFVVELPDHRLVAIQPLDPHEDDSLVDDLIAMSPAFKAALERSLASPRRPFRGSADG